MLKRLLLALLLGLGFGQAWAQATTETLESRQFKQRLRGQYLQNDTAQAIISLYSRRQAGGASWITAAVLSAVRLSIGTTTTSNYGGYPATTTTSGNPAVAFLAAAPLIGYGVGKLAHYSNAHLGAVLTAYGAGQPLPHALRRKLKPRFFKQPIVEYKTVKYKPVPAN